MFAIEVEFLRGIYEGGGRSDDQPPEWPPHPARLINALVASADLDDESQLEALRWLEALPPPHLIASEVVECGGRSSYVPTNLLHAKYAGYNDLPARTALGPRSWHALSPAAPVVSIVWSVDAPAGMFDVLDVLVRSVPYLGRSTSPIAASIRAWQGVTDGDERSTWVPTSNTLTAAKNVDLPAPGYVDGLMEAFVEERSAWSVPRRVVGYAAEVSEIESGGIAMSPYGEVFIVGFGGGRRIGVGHSLLVASRLREAIESYLDGGPLVLRGVPPRHLRSEAEKDLAAPAHQISIAALPFVGSKHADGELRGLAVILPRNIESEDRTLVVRGLGATLAQGLALGHLGRVKLDASVQTLQTLQTDRWTATSQWWTTALPMSANRHTRKSSREWRIGQVFDSCAHLGLPEPVNVEVSSGPMLTGATRLSKRQRLRHPGTRSERVTDSFHVYLDLGVPVSGPIVLGGLRRYGLGLMLPVGPRSSATSDEGDVARPDTER